MLEWASGVSPSIVASMARQDKSAEVPSILTLASIAVVIAALYVAKGVLVPFTLAVLLYEIDISEGAMPQALQVVIIKPSKYLADGVAERFSRGFIRNSTVPYMPSMVPAEVDGMPVETQTIDEYVLTDLQYLKLHSRPEGKRTLVALVGVQSHQFDRALDLAANYWLSVASMNAIQGPKDEQTAAGDHRHCVAASSGRSEGRHRLSPIPQHRAHAALVSARLAACPVDGA